MKILLDTNVWRYLIDSKQHDRLFQTAHRSGVQVAVAPIILIETLRLSDPVFRKKIVALQARECWKRLMPDPYLECHELLQVILKHYPHWLRQTRDTARFRKLRHDWTRSNGGFWTAARRDTEAIAARYASQDTRVLEVAREQARDTREAVLRHGQVIVGRKTLAQIPGSWTTHNGEKVETDFWRVYATAVWETALTEHSAFRDWLGCDVDLNLLLTYYASEFLDFWAYKVQAKFVPRTWIRAAMFALQSERKITDGTPTDAAIAVHLVDVNAIVSADKNFVAMANRIHEEAPFNLGSAFLIQGGMEGIEQLFQFISAAKSCQKIEPRSPL